MRLWVRKRRFWWTACDPEMPLAEMDTTHYVRARTREKVIAKAIRRFGPPDPKSFPWEEIEVEGVDPGVR